MKNCARDEEITQQYEELQAQTEELEGQKEELQKQAEKLESQSEDLNELNEQLTGREVCLETLLDAYRRSLKEENTGEMVLLKAVPGAALRLMGVEIASAAMYRVEEGRVKRVATAGLQAVAATGGDSSLAALVIGNGRAACLPDAEMRSDLCVPGPFQSVLAAPIGVAGTTCAAIEWYGRERRDWSEDEFKHAEWLGQQTGLFLEAIRLHEELRRGEREADEATARKSRFLAAVSHDVRTPANAIHLIAEVIRRKAQQSGAVELAKRASDLQANTRSLIELITDVLDLTRLDAERCDLQRSAFDLHALLDSEAKRFALFAERKGLSIEYQGECKPIWLYTDRVKLTRIISNLMDNAIKFSEKGKVRLLCRPEKEARIVEVSDEGVGIPSDQLAHIFDEFYQLSNPARERGKGNGLGLAIVKRLCDALDCRVSVVSKLNEGSCFSIELPQSLMVQVDAGVDMAVPSETSHTTAGLNGISVLLVEDDAHTRSAAAEYLRMEGAQVLEAVTAAQGRELLYSKRPNALLLDLMLPDQDGTTILELLHHDRPDELRCVIVLTGNATEERMQQLQHFRLQGMMIKPIDLSLLIAAIQKAESDASGGSL